VVSESNPHCCCRHVVRPELALDEVLYQDVGNLDQVARFLHAFRLCFIELHTFVHDKLIAVVAEHMEVSVSGEVLWAVFHCQAVHSWGNYCHEGGGKQQTYGMVIHG